jgi:multicomponent Na+:H+ antiporter subunit B
MQSPLLTIAARHLHYLLLIFSLIVLLRGHNEPGGGFIGGLVASTAFILSAITGSLEKKDQRKLVPHRWIMTGLLVCLFSGLLPLLTGKPFLTSLWIHAKTDWLGSLHVGTPLLFDLGVYLTVIGVILLMVYTLFEDV